MLSKLEGTNEVAGVILVERILLSESIIEVSATIVALSVERTRGVGFAMIAAVWLNGFEGVDTGWNEVLVLSNPE